MRQLAFDTLQFTEKLILSGVPKVQAKAHAEVLVDVIQMNLDNLASKNDLAGLQHDLRETETRLKHDIRETENRLQHEIRDTENRLKYDIKETKKHLEHNIEDTKKHLEHNIEDTKKHLEHNIEDTENRLRYEIQSTENRLQYNIQNVEHKVDKLATEVNGKFTILYWMFGLILTSMGTIIGKLLLSEL